MGVTQRVRQIYAHYVKTGNISTKRKIGRPKKEPTQRDSNGDRNLCCQSSRRN